MDTTTGMMGQRGILKPVFNRDIPDDSDVLNINMIGSVRQDLGASTAVKVPGAHQIYGSVFSYKFPEFVSAGNIQNVTPETLLPTNQVYDVDFEGELSGMSVKKLHYLNTYVGTSDLPVATFESGVNTMYGMNTGNLAQADITQQFPNSFCLFFVGKGKQKELGDFINEYSYPVGAAVQGQLFHMTPWLFDKFCHQVKPIWAKHFYPKPSGITQRHMMEFKDQTNVYEIELPGAKTEMRWDWVIREFHRCQDYGGNLTPTDTYANEILLGSLGPYSMDCFMHARFRVYYKATRVKANTLYFQTQREYVFEQFRGDRKEYGTHDYDLDTGLDTNQLRFDGVVTCQKGEISLFQDGETSIAAAPTNIIQDTSDRGGNWY